MTADDGPCDNLANIDGIVSPCPLPVAFGVVYFGIAIPCCPTHTAKLTKGTA